MTNLPPPEEKLHVTQCKFLSLRPQPALGCGVIRELHDIIDFRWQRGQEGQEQGGQLFSDEQRRLPLFVDYTQLPLKDKERTIDMECLSSLTLYCRMVKIVFYKLVRVRILP